MADQEPVFLKCAWRLLPLMMLLYFFNITDRVNVGFAALTMNHDLNFSPAVYGFGAGAFFLGYALFQVPANAILERVGARRWIFLILLVWGALSASNAAVHNAAQFYTVRVLLGIVEAGFFPGMILYLTYWFTKSFSARLVALFMAAVPAANVVGAPLSSLILGLNGVGHLAGWQWLFVIEGIPTMLLAFVVLKVLPDGPRDAPWLDDEERGIIAARLASDDTSEHRSFWPALRDPRVYALGVVYFGYSIAFYGVGLWMPQIVQGMGVSNLMTGFVIAPAYLVAMIGMILWSRSSDKRGERVWHVALPALLMMTAFLVGSLVHDNLVIFLALSLVLVGSMALQGPFWVLPSTFLGGAAAAGGIALINTMGTAAGGFAGPYILGLLKQATGGYAAGMAVLAVGPLLTAGIVLILGRAARRARVIKAAA
ncbi:MAG TPA: MFS transporter [Rhizomicrobium sp.]|jgi:ACS family tartrate transporter-like MFS transporter|nr:MFS transporter [Rhizomicrobium sp.]